jgi:hypothetical protein
VMTPNPPTPRQAAQRPTPAPKAPERLPLLPRTLQPVGGKRFMVEKGAGGGSYIVEK